MPDFDIIGSNLYGQQSGMPPLGFDIMGAPLGRGLYNSLGTQQSIGAGQPQGAPVSGLVAGALGLPTTGGANPGMSYLAQGQGQQAGEQPQQMSPLLAGIIGASQPGSMAGAASGPLQAAQPQNPNIGSGVGGLLRAMIYGGQSQDV